MKLELNIALRYLFSKKKHNAINVISSISICGIALATLTLICTLSVFNGFQESVASFFSAFDPELKVLPTQGKFIINDSLLTQKIDKQTFIENYTLTLEENAMVKFREKQSMVTLKGVDEQFHHVTQINTLLLGQGIYKLKDQVVYYGIPGVELAGNLSTGIQSAFPLEVFAPKSGRVNMANPTASFNKNYLYLPGVLFSVGQPQYDARYIICDLEFVQNLYGYHNRISAIEINLKEGVNVEKARKELSKELGADFTIQNRFEQQTDVYNIMRVEKLISYLFLTFIVLIASFNIISSLSMLIIEKKNDMQVLINLGATKEQVSRIFLLEGQIITVIGTISGLLLGIALVLIQQYFGIITLGNGGMFVSSSYPVSLEMGDIIITAFTVLLVGFISAVYPIRYLSKKVLA